ncbi:MAG: efflux RND transporter periplasmic adaptor subunit [Candidatus Omnitrophota bacterium]
MSIKLLWVLVLLCAGGALSQGFAMEKADQQAVKELYVCPMHPQITSDRKGSCPICGMDLVKKEVEEQNPAGVFISANKQQLIGVRMGVVKRQKLALEIVTTGKVAYNADIASGQGDYLKQIDTPAVRWRGTRRTPVYVTVYEYELGLLRKGQEVQVEAVAFAGDIFIGKVAALKPVINPESRTMRVRVDVEDRQGKLRADMFVNAKIMVDLGEKIAVPEEAVMDSGRRKIVYVVKDTRFTPREVVLGPKAGEFYEVRSGLDEGEEVVTSGNFMIDAESKLKGAL